MPATFTIAPQGPFSLRESAMFGFGQREASAWDGVMRLAFCLDDYATQVGVEVRQDASGVHCTVVGAAPTDAVQHQVARVLSLLDDASGYVEVATRDAAVARLQAAAPGLRPPLFYSAYEASAWAVISARRPAQQMRIVRQRLSEAHGAVFDVAGERLAAFPTPEQILAVKDFPGLPQVTIDRLHSLAQAALNGRLDSDRIRASDPDVAMQELQRLPGIGPFYSALIVIRAVGVRDVLPPDEPMVREAARTLYGLERPPTVAEFAELAEPWRPWRTWIVVLVRAATPRLAAAK